MSEQNGPQSDRTRPSAGAGAGDRGSPDPMGDLLAELKQAPEAGLDVYAETVASTEPRSVAPTRLPEIEGYRVLKSIGEGGMGSVWLAYQQSTRRQVALKTLGEALLGSPIARGRFEREVELAATLDHPAIAKVFDSGLDHGTYFYAMEFVEGLALDRYATGRALSRHERVELMARVCDGVQHAHQRGVIHRDLKPGNVLVTEEGQPKLLDFGLAKALADAQSKSRGVTISGDVAGTPAYMAPEQAEGDIKSIDTRTDVYALGVMLFELIAGRLPHEASGGYVELLARISRTDAPQLRSIATHVDVDLNAVVMKALSRSRDERYASAGELANDLRRWLDGNTVLARPQTTLYLIRKKINRNRVPTALASVAVLATIGATVFYIVDINRERQKTYDALQQAGERAREAQQNLQSAYEQQASVLALVGGLTSRIEPLLASEGTSPALRQEFLNLGQRALAGNGFERHPQLDAVRTEVDLSLQLYQAQIAASEGRLTDAQAGLAKAFDRYVDRHKESPEHRSRANDLCVVATRLARVQLRQGLASEAVTSLETGLKAVEGFDDSQSLQNRSIALLALGDATLSTRPGVAKDHFEQAVEAGIRSDSMQGRRVAAAALTRLADLELAGEPDASSRRTALELFDRAERQLAPDAHRADVGDQRVEILGRLAELHLALDEIGRAVVRYESAVELVRALITDHGATTPRRRELIRLLRGLSAALLVQGRTDEAGEASRQAEAIEKALAIEADPTPVN